MKYEGHFNIGSNSAGKGSKDTVLVLSKEERKIALRRREETLERIFKNRAEKKICFGCGELKEWVQRTLTNPPRHYCEDCKKTVLKR